MPLSIIIPTLNEAENIGGLIEHTRTVGESEIIVVDGGSDDGTVERAQSADVVLQSDPGRATQQNAAAAIASGSVLLFLHADCRLEPGAIESVKSAFEDPRVVAGCFRQRIDANGLRFRLLEKGNAARVRLCKWAYGDQGIFVRREAFEAVGGFPDLRFMEDLFLMKRLKKQGRVVLLKDRLTVSARRWQKKGIVRQTLRNWGLILLAQIGVSPNRLARFYPNVR